MNVRIRTAVAADYPGFARVAHEVHEHHVEVQPDVFRKVDVIMSYADFMKLLEDHDVDVLVAEHDGEIVGYAILLHRATSRSIHVPRQFSFIDNFGVLQSKRRLGIGRRLFKACVSRARERGSQKLELDVWEANTAAVRFYESLGMKLKRRWLSMDLQDSSLSLQRNSFDHCVSTKKYEIRREITMTTESSLKDHIRSLEERLLRPEIRKSPEELDALLAEDFIEFGSSGGVVNKQEAIKGMLSEPPLKFTLSDFDIKVLAPNVVLATYRACRHNDMRHSLRSSIWILNEGKWQMLFHQGTNVKANTVGPKQL